MIPAVGAGRNKTGDAPIAAEFNLESSRVESSRVENETSGWFRVRVWPRDRRFPSRLWQITSKRFESRRARHTEQNSPERNYLEFFPSYSQTGGRGGEGRGGAIFSLPAFPRFIEKAEQKEGTHQSSQFAASARACLALKRRRGSGRKFNLVAARASTDILLRR